MGKWVIEFDSALQLLIYQLPNYQILDEENFAVKRYFQWVASYIVFSVVWGRNKCHPSADCVGFAALYPLRDELRAKGRELNAAFLLYFAIPAHV